MKESAESRVVNGPISLVPNPARNQPEPEIIIPNPKTNLKPTPCPNKIRNEVRSKIFSNLATLF